MRRACRRAMMSALILLMLAPGAHTQPAKADEAATQRLRATMQEIFHALTTVFPLSLNEQPFQDAANRADILRALRTLAGNAASLEAHGHNASQSFHFLRQSLAQRAQEAVQRYEQGDMPGARFTVQQLTENCFACHSRLPNPRHVPLGQRFLEVVQIETLPVKDRVRLAVATRQFDTALDTYETLFGSTAMTAAAIDLTGAFEDYLKVAIRVRHDVTRPMTTLETFRQRPDVPEYLLYQTGSWIEALQELRLHTSQDHALRRARALIQAGQQRNRFPADRLGLIHFVAASGLLHRYVEARPADTGQLAEAYYLLGVAESHISRSFWLSQTEFFLETAIRLAPTSHVAKQAYRFLEDYVLMGYTGSSGLHLPADVRAHLAELRRLLNGS